MWFPAEVLTSFYHNVTHTMQVGVNMITQTNGFCVLPHVKLLWDTSWNTRRLLAHVLDLMVTPMPSYLSPELISIVNCFLKDNFDMNSDDCLISSAFDGKVTASSADIPYKHRLDRLPRLTQIHLNIVALYLSDRDKYNDIVKQYVSKFAVTVSWMQSLHYFHYYFSWSLFCGIWASQKFALDGWLHHSQLLTDLLYNKPRQRNKRSSQRLACRTRSSVHDTDLSKTNK